MLRIVAVGEWRMAISENLMMCRLQSAVCIDGMWRWNVVVTADDYINHVSCI